MQNYKNTAILDLLRRQGPLTREDVIRHTGMSTATAARFVAALIKKGAIRRAGRKATGRRGRQSTFLDINHKYGSLVGVEIKMDHAVAILCDFRGAVIEHRSIPLDLQALAAEGKDLAHIAVSGARELMGPDGIDTSKIKGLDGADFFGGGLTFYPDKALLGLKLFQ